MNADGFVQLAIDETGEKTLLVDYQANDIQLIDCFSAYVSDDEEDSLVSIHEVEQKFKAKYGEDVQFKNKLLLISFSYRSVSYFNGECTEYDDETEVVEMLILDHDYKTTWQKNLTTMYQDEPLEQLEDKEAWHEIHSWEEFYDETFALFKPKKINHLEVLFK